MKLKNKVVVITGASDGIGKEIALRLAKEKTQLALIARNKNKLTEVAEKAQRFGSIAKYYPCDIRDFDELKNVIFKIKKDFQMIDVLINDAGVWQKMAQLDEIDQETIAEVINTNLIGLIYTTKLFLPSLRKSNEAAIINIVSKSGIVAQEGQSVYTASKYGVRGFTEVLRVDLKGTNIKVAGIYQGGTDTKMFAKVGENVSTENFTNPADLADVVAYILSRPAKIWLYDVRLDR